ncbi:PelD GGDEF domain-containing protein [Burkholderia sp. Ac-20353]|uniref:PelD GGDEF domain-containing protein n=1 Tax=Burkholderia sp. Ac-20353 TaxID=2703894 RepID=UPI00197C63E3|nr:PelD GGDEF domain-containing protein [Burkholderia sp. Ac-20353]MBN3790121.1 sugar ABC transporter permease [Burkholderia sp. Ac-20353]
MAIDTKSTRFDAGMDTRARVQHASLRSRLLHRSTAARFASLLPRDHSASYVALETLVLSVFVFALCRVLSPADPLLLAKAFPWLWLLPLFVALRYGTVAGLGGGALLLAAWVVFYARLPLADVFPRDFFVGGFITMLVAGQFSDTWATRLSQARVSNTYLSERLSVLTNNQFLLRLSHDQLEQDLLVRPATLRDALARLRDLTLRNASGPATTATLPGAQPFLEAVTQACQIEAAQIHAWHDGALAATPVAGVGPAFEFDADDLLVTAALDELSLAHLQSVDARDRAHTRYVACAPLIGAGDAIVGALVVSELPFLALTADNLQLMFVMCSYYANGVRHAAITRDVLQAFPDCPYDFALEYARLADLQRTSGVASSVVLLRFDASKQAQAMFEHVERTNLDFHVQWIVRTGNKCALVFIMPLSNDAAVDAQLQRIETDVRNQFGIGFTEARVVARWVSLAGTPSDSALRQLLADCDEAT